MDALSQVLRVVHLAGTVFFQAPFTAPGCFPSPHADAYAARLEPTAGRLVIFHLVTEGSPATRAWPGCCRRGCHACSR
jgi:hypothetical protein